MKTYEATIDHGDGTGELRTTSAPDYTKAYLNILYIIPKTSIIINLKEIWKNDKRKHFRG